MGLGDPGARLGLGDPGDRFGLGDSGDWLGLGALLVTVTGFKESSLGSFESFTN